MQTEINKWGNSLGIRIPSQITKALGIKSGNVTTVTIEKGRIIITPQDDTPSLQQRLQSMKAAVGREDEIDSGEDVGLEENEW